MTLTTNPTIVIVPGAWPVEESFHPLIQSFSERSYLTICRVPLSYPKLPVNENPVNPDMLHLREKVLIPLIEEGKYVILLMHSYGGIYGGAAVQGLSKKQRMGKGEEGGIVALIFLAAFVGGKGETALDTMGIDPNILPDWIEHDKTTDLVRLTRAREMLFYNLPEDEATRLANALPAQPYFCFSTKMEYEPYSDPIFSGMFGYIFTEADRILPLEAQRMYAKRAGAGTVMLKGSGHSAHVERPGEVVRVVLEFLERIEKNFQGI